MSRSHRQILRSIARRLDLSIHEYMDDEAELEDALLRVLRSQGIPSDKHIVSDLRLAGLLYEVPANSDPEVMKRILETEGIILKTKTPIGRATNEALGSIIKELKAYGRCEVTYSKSKKKVVVSQRSIKGRKPLASNRQIDDIRELYQTLKKKYKSDPGKQKWKKISRIWKKMLRELRIPYPNLSNETDVHIQVVQYYNALTTEATKGHPKMEKVVNKYLSEYGRRKKKKTKKKSKKKRRVSK